MRYRALWLALPLLGLLAGPGSADDPPWNRVLLKDGTAIVGTVTDATNRSYQVTLFGRTESIDVTEVLTIAPRVHDLDAGVYLVDEAVRSLPRGDRERTMLLLKTGLRLLRDYVPTGDREIAQLDEATGRGYLLGARLFVEHDQLDKARDAYRHVTVRYAQTAAAAQATERLKFVDAEIERRTRAAAREETGSLTWSDLFDREPAEPLRPALAAAPGPAPGAEREPGPPAPKVTLGAIQTSASPEAALGPADAPKAADASEPADLEAARARANEWIPLAAGNWWKYRLNETVETVLIDAEVKGEDRIEFPIVKTVVTGGQTFVEKSLWVLTEAGLFRREGEHREPILLFPIEIHAPSEHNYEATEGKTRLLWRYAARDVRVDIPAEAKARQESFPGCLDVEMTTLVQLDEKSQIRVLSHKYYAPRIGLVKVSLTGEELGVGKYLVDFKIARDES